MYEEQFDTEGNGHLQGGRSQLSPYTATKATVKGGVLVYQHVPFLCPYGKRAG